MTDSPDLFDQFVAEATATLHDRRIYGGHEDQSAELFVQAFGHEVRWLQERGVWRICSRTARPGYWSDEDRSGARVRMRAVALAQATYLVQEVGTKQALKDADKVRTDAHQQRALKLAQTRPSITARARDFDTRPLLLGVSNGVVDLETGELRPATPNLLLTKRAAVAYNPEAEAPLWLSHVERLANSDPETKDLLHRACGMSLIGATSRKTHGFISLYGGGGNGKGTFGRVLRFVLGDYAHELPARELTARGDSHSTSLADLEGKRFVMVSELSRRQLDSDRVNGITGGDPITARKMRKDNITFEPSHTLWAFGNALPRLGDVNQSARRRYRPVRTAPSLKPDEVDPAWDDKLKAEAEGILAWLVRGALAYQKADWRLPEPKAMTDLREESLEEQDLFGQWFEERAFENEGDFVTTADLIKDVNTWRSVQRNLRDMTQAEQQDLYEWLRHQGFKPDKRGGKRGRIGLRLRFNPFPAETRDGLPL